MLNNVKIALISGFVFLTSFGNGYTESAGVGYNQVCAIADAENTADNCDMDLACRTIGKKTSCQYYKCNPEDCDIGASANAKRNCFKHGQHCVNHGKWIPGKVYGASLNKHWADSNSQVLDKSKIAQNGELNAKCTMAPTDNSAADSCDTSLACTGKGSRGVCKLDGCKNGCGDSATLTQQRNCQMNEKNKCVNVGKWIQLGIMQGRKIIKNTNYVGQDAPAADPAAAPAADAAPADDGSGQ